jgi:ATP-dependent Lon protease
VVQLAGERQATATAFHEIMAIKTAGPSTPLPTTLPLLPLRDLVLFPQLNSSLFLGRAAVKNAAASAIATDGRLAAVLLRSSRVEEVTREGLHDVGVMASVLSMARMPDGTIKLTVFGVQRIRVGALSDGAAYQSVEMSPVDELATAPPSDSKELLEAIAAQGPTLKAILPEAIFESLPRLGSPGHLAHLIGAHVRGVYPSVRQELLELLDPWERLRRGLALLRASADPALDLPDALEVIREWLEKRVKETGSEGLP